MRNIKSVSIHVLTIIGLNLCYTLIIVKNYNYMGFELNFNTSKMIIISFITFLLILYGETIKNTFLSMVWNVFFYLFYCGESIYFQYASNNNWEILFGIILFLVLLPIISNSKKRLITYQFKGDTLKGLFLISCVLFVPVFLVYFRHINIRNLLFLDIYDTREVFRGVQTSIVGYLRAPLAMIILPISIVKSLEEKRYGYFSVSVFMIIFIFLAGAVKSIFIGLIAVLLFYFFSYRKKVFLFKISLFVLTWLSFISYYWKGNLFLIDVFIRRVIFVPAYLNDVFTSYFRENYTYYSHSPLGLGLVDYKYDQSLSFFIGNEIIGREGLNANVGVLTEGYASFGVPGILFIVMLLLILFKYFDAIRFNSKFFGILFIYIYYLNTSFLSILLLTHGLLFLIIVSYFYLSKKENNPLNTN
ncbi:hypothetical protein IGJ83_001827 [Enterococcus pernyi]